MARLIELRQTAPERFLARFDTGEELRTTLAVVTDFHLRSGKELTASELDALRAASERSRCRQRALRIIGARAMSVKELTDRLKEKGESPENAEDAAAWLQEMHLLDDAQYAAMCVRHYAAKGYGAGRIRSELYRRGIPRELWDDALQELPEQDDPVRQRNQAMREELRKLRGDVERRRKAMQELYLDKVSGLIDSAQFFEMNKSFLDEVSSAEARIEKLESELEQQKEESATIQTQMQRVRELAQVSHLTRELAVLLVDRVVVGPRDARTGEQKITIEWNF